MDEKLTSVDVSTRKSECAALENTNLPHLPHGRSLEISSELEVSDVLSSLDPVWTTSVIVLVYMIESVALFFNGNPSIRVW